jgi:hypothetical protein
MEWPGKWGNLQFQIRKALQARNASGDFSPVSFKPFEEAYKTLTEKLQPMVYELGFLKVYGKGLNRNKELFLNSINRASP